MAGVLKLALHILVVHILTAGIAYSQPKDIKIRVADEASLQPLANAQITCETKTYKTGPDGYASLHLVSDTAILHITLLGYEPASMRWQDAQSDVRLLRKYYGLEEVPVAAHKLPVDSLLRRCANAMPGAYIFPHDSIFLFQYKTFLYYETDTLLDAATDVYWQPAEDKGKMVYRLLAIGDTPLQFTTNRLDTPMLQDIVEVLSFPRESLVPSLLYIAKSIKNYYVISSVFYENGQKYYDLLFISRQASPLKYGLKARLFGFGKGRGDKRYAHVRQIQFSAADYGLSLFRDMSVDISPESLKEYLEAKDKTVLRRQLTKVISDTAGHSLMQFVFGKAAGREKLLPLEVIYSDNCQHPFQKKLMGTQPIFFISHKFAGIVSPPTGLQPFKAELNIQKKFYSQ